MQAGETRPLERQQTSAATLLSSTTGWPAETEVTAKETHHNRSKWLHTETKNIFMQKDRLQAGQMSPVVMYLANLADERGSRAYSQLFFSPLQWRGPRDRASLGEALGNHFPLAAPQSWDTPLVAGTRQLLHTKTMLKPDHLSRGRFSYCFLLYQASWQELPLFWTCFHCLCSGLTEK